MIHHREAPLLDAAIRVDGLPAEGRAIRVEATVEQRHAIAARLGITAVERLTADLEAKRFRGGIRVTGALSAAIEQPCVVSLQPVHQAISEPVDRVYLPEGEAPARKGAEAEIFVDLESEDVPDRFEGNEADLSEMLIETVALAIDPYPRAAGAALETTGDRIDPVEDSPFARLKGLKLRSDDT